MIKIVLFFHLLTIFLVAGSIGNAQTGIFDKSADVGNPKMKGSATYNPVTKEYILRGGDTISGLKGMNSVFLYKTLEGDFIV